MVYVYYDFASVLGYSRGEDGVFVVLGCGVGAAEEFFYAFDAIDIAFGCSCGIAAVSGVTKIVLKDFYQEGFKFSNVHCANRHVVIYSNHCFVFCSGHSDCAVVSTQAEQVNYSTSDTTSLVEVAIVK